MTGMKPGKKSRGVFDIGVRIKHCVHRPEFGTMIMMVDLHAAQINQAFSFRTGALELPDRLATAFCIDRSTLYIQSIRIERAFPSGLGQANGIQNAGRYAVDPRRVQDLRFANAGRSLRGAQSRVLKDKRRQYGQSQNTEFVHGPVPHAD